MPKQTFLSITSLACHTDYNEHYSEWGKRPQQHRPRQCSSEKNALKPSHTLLQGIESVVRVPQSHPLNALLAPPLENEGVHLWSTQNYLPEPGTFYCAIYSLIENIQQKCPKQNSWLDRFPNFYSFQILRHSNHVGHNAETAVCAI